MKGGRWGWTAIVVLLALLGTEAEAGRTLPEFSGDPMQSYESRMMESPLMQYPGLFGLSFWPYVVAYPPASIMTTKIVQSQTPELNQPPPLPPTPARPKFWTARCGAFVEIEVSATMNFMEEERKPCSP
jgi:hypothetical protein